MDALQDFAAGDTNYVDKLNENNADIKAAIEAVEAAAQVSSAKGNANGYAGLDSGGKVPVTQLPDLSATYQTVAEKGVASGYAPLGPDGIVPFDNLPPGLAPDLAGVETTVHAVATYVPLSQKGAANGVATLGAGGKIPTDQLPTQPVMLPMFYAGKPDDGITMWKVRSAIAFTLPSGLAGSNGDVGTNPAATTTLDVQVNGASKGSVSISTGGAVTFSFDDPVSVAVGDVIKIVNQATADADCADISVTLYGTR